MFPISIFNFLIHGLFFTSSNAWVYLIQFQLCCYNVLLHVWFFFLREFPSACMCRCCAFPISYTVLSKCDLSRSFLWLSEEGSFFVCLASSGQCPWGMGCCVHWSCFCSLHFRRVPSLLHCCVSCDCPPLCIWFSPEVALLWGCQSQACLLPCSWYWETPSPEL